MNGEVCRVYLDSVVLYVLVISHGDDIRKVWFRQAVDITWDVDFCVFSKVGRV